MMRKWLPIGFVLFARWLVHAQEAPAPTAPAAPTEQLSSYRFDGQLVYRSSDGSFVLLFPDAVFVGWGDDGCDITRQSSERLIFYPDGVFQLTVSNLVITSLRIEVDPSGRPRNTKVGPELVRWPCYRFRVEGCDDGVVLFGPEPPASNIELSCPGRESTPSDRPASAAAVRAAG